MKSEAPGKIKVNSKQLKVILEAHSGGATFSPGCSQEHPDLKKKIIYNNFKKFICLPLKKIMNTLK